MPTYRRSPTWTSPLLPTPGLFQGLKSFAVGGGTSVIVTEPIGDGTVSPPAVSQVNAY